LKAGFYPASAKNAESRLKFYSGHFITVEVDSTYYALPSERNAFLWASRTPYAALARSSHLKRLQPRARCASLLRLVGSRPMLRLRFLPGLILGLIVGLAAGTVIVLLTLPPRGADLPAPLPSQVQELTRKLEAASESRERADRQFEQFQKLAEQMTATFNSLERRFKLLEEEQRLRDAQGIQAPAQRPPAPAPPPTASRQAPPQPEAATRPGGDTPPSAPEQDPSPQDQPSDPPADDPSVQQ
jgi:hypothetical protein